MHFRLRFQVRVCFLATDRPTGESVLCEPDPQLACCTRSRISERNIFPTGEGLPVDSPDLGARLLRLPLGNRGPHGIGLHAPSSSDCGVLQRLRARLCCEKTPIRLFALAGLAALATIWLVPRERVRQSHPRKWFHLPHSRTAR